MADDSAQIDADQQLVKRVQQGDKKAFDLLVLKYQHRIAGLVSRFMYDSSEVQDVTQEAFIKAYRALPNFRGDSQFYTWLYRIAINTAKNYLVAKKRRPPGGDVDIDDATMTQISKMTGGKYFRATDRESLEKTYKEIDQLEKTIISEKSFTNKAEHFLPLALAAAICLLLEFLLKRFVFKAIP